MTVVIVFQSRRSRLFFLGFVSLYRVLISEHKGEFPGAWNMDPPRPTLV
jgi:hypothetical protein